MVDSFIALAVETGSKGRIVKLYMGEGEGRLLKSESIRKKCPVTFKNNTTKTDMDSGGSAEAMQITIKGQSRFDELQHDCDHGSSAFLIHSN